MDYPIVGLSTYFADSSWSTWHRPAALVPSSYLDMVQGAGAVPILLPQSGSDLRQNPKRIIERLDALVLIGGGDLDPSLYGEVPEPSTTGIDQRRDRHELDLLEAALNERIPVLAICRGLQILNIFLGGTLHQHVDGHREGPGTFVPIEVETTPGSLMQKAVGQKDKVLCSHHQAIEKLGAGLIPTAYATGNLNEALGAKANFDEAPLVEAVELEGHPMVIGVQWHPEESGDGRILSLLLEPLRADHLGQKTGSVENDEWG